MKKHSFAIIGAIAAAVVLYLVFKSSSANAQAAGVASAISQVQTLEGYMS